MSADRDAGIENELLSTLAHELKTPLTPLKTVAQLIRSRIAKVRAGSRELDLEALDRNVATIERQVDRMDRLVTDLLEVSRVGREAFELSRAPFDLTRAVREVAAQWSSTLEDEGRHTLRIEVAEALVVNGDEARVEQAVSNLISNAVKFSPRGGEVVLRLERSNGEAIVTVSDHGIGIDAQELDGLGAQPFARGSRSRGFAGVGIGLYLTRRVAEGHGGSLRVESDGPNKGSTARLMLPL